MSRDYCMFSGQAIPREEVRPGGTATPSEHWSTENPRYSEASWGTTEIHVCETY